MLKDADALIYYIYKVAAQESRDLNDSEKQQLLDIKSSKIRLLAQLTQMDTEADEDWRADQAASISATVASGICRTSDTP